MTEISLKRFFERATAINAVKVLDQFKDNCHIGYSLSKFFLKIFTNDPNLTLRASNFAYQCKDYQSCYDYLSSLRKIEISEELYKIASENQSMCIPHIENDYIFYNEELVKRICSKTQNQYPLVTFTITTCKRYDLFEKTINSFLNCCLDLDKIDKWFLVDDNSSEEDREKMKKNYPFFEFYFKDISEKGHPRSMNIIRKHINTPYIFHMEDDWKFISKRNYISECLEILNEEDNYGQCLINKNYSETFEDTKIIGGYLRKTPNHLKYYVHEHCKNDDEYKDFYKRHGLGSNCAYWKHYSFRPSLLKKYILDELGEFDEKASHFEAVYSDKYYKSGYISTFLDGIYCLHTGRLTSQLNDNTKLNAYALNNEKQFDKSENQPDKTTSKVKTFVLNLDRRPDRWKQFTEQVEPKFLNYNRFSAVDGSKLIPNKQLQRIFEGNDYSMRSGMVGCAMSHIKMYIDLLHSDVDALCIFEDDVKFVPDFQTKFLHLCKNLPKDWDICYLGHHMWPRYATPDFFDKEKLPEIEKWGVLKSLTYSIGGTGGYLISKAGAKKLLDFVNEIGMTNGIDTMQQKSADQLDVYYCKPHLIYGECWTNNKASDTDIQNDFYSLDLMETVSRQEWPERLKKNGIYNVDEALLYKNISYKIIPISETTHLREALEKVTDYKLDLPFDSIDGGDMTGFAHVLSQVVTLSDSELVLFTKTFCLENKYGIIFPHDRDISIQELIMRYLKKFINLRTLLLSKENILIVHLSRWKKTDVQVFVELLELLHKFNPNIKLMTINGLETKVKNPFIVKKEIYFPSNYANDDWGDDKIRYDQDVFRTSIQPVLEETMKEILN